MKSKTEATPDLFKKIQEVCSALVRENPISDRTVGRLRQYVLELGKKLDPERETDGWWTRLNRESTHATLSVKGGLEVFLDTLQSAERAYRARYNT